jgi:hypothetical protein
MGTHIPMSIGTSIFLIAVGAILRYAVTVSTSGFNVHTAGTILMVVGAIGLLISLIWMATASRRTVVGGPVVRERDVY